jgi:hypothetical protein
MPSSKPWNPFEQTKQPKWQVKVKVQECHSERSEESQEAAQGKLREESQRSFVSLRMTP